MARAYQDPIQAEIVPLGIILGVLDGSLDDSAMAESVHDILTGDLEGVLRNLPVGHGGLVFIPREAPLEVLTLRNGLRSAAATLRHENGERGLLATASHEHEAAVTVYFWYSGDADELAHREVLPSTPLPKVPPSTPMLSAENPPPLPQPVASLPSTVEDTLTQVTPNYNQSKQRRRTGWKDWAWLSALITPLLLALFAESWLSNFADNFVDAAYTWTTVNLLLPALIVLAVIAFLTVPIALLVVPVIVLGKGSGALNKIVEDYAPRWLARTWHVITMALMVGLVLLGVVIVIASQTKTPSHDLIDPLDVYSREYKQFLRDSDPR